MSFRILSADTDALEWQHLFKNLPEDGKDVHYLPGYAQAHKLEGKAYLAVWERGELFAMQPFVLRCARMSSPYGYGGLTGRGFLPDEPYLAGCDRYRFLPWASHQAGTKEKEVVAIDLTGDIDAGLRKGHASSIKLAQKCEVMVEEVSSVTENIAEFWQMYDQTMVRRGAEESWRLPLSHFLDMNRLMLDNFALFFAYVGDEIESSCIVLHGYDTAYYHFAGTYARHPNLGVNNLLVYEVARWSRGMDYRRLHLGGGVTADPEDSVLKFKSGFSPDRIAVNSIRTQ